jgi:hypothetical protein
MQTSLMGETELELDKLNGDEAQTRNGNDVSNGDPMNVD